MNTIINQQSHRKAAPLYHRSGGDINEWYYDWDDWDFQHRHQSHLISVYPGHRSRLTRHLIWLMQPTRSLEIKGDRTTGWSTGWRINLWARLHNAKQAYHLYQKLLTYVSPDNYQGADRRRSGGTYPTSSMLTHPSNRRQFRWHGRCLRDARAEWRRHRTTSRITRSMEKRFDYAVSAPVADTK